MSSILTAEQLSIRITEGETLYTEFKSAKVHTDALSATLVSFLNTDGGVLLIGVDDDGQISGVDNPDAMRQKIDQVLMNNISPPAVVNIENVPYQDKLILAVRVARGVDRPYQTQRGQCYIRVNAGKRLASRLEIQRMFINSGALHYDELSITASSLKDVDSFSLDKFLRAGYRIEVDSLRRNEEYRLYLNNLKAMAEDELTVAGALFFASTPQYHLPTAKIEFASFEGNFAGNVILDRKTIEGRLPDQLESILTVIGLHLKRNGTIRSYQPEVMYEMPMTMVREVIINALVHRDYSYSSTIRVMLFDDRLEIHSPGRLPNGITIDNIRMGIHVERNPILTSFMGKLGLMTQIGTGIMRVLAEAKAAGLPEPKLEETDLEFVVTLYRATET
ncbi:MAG: RNA-binding domain-containing protein [Chloroflexota bacterium]